MIHPGTGGPRAGAPPPRGARRRILVAAAVAWILLVLASFARERVLEAATFRRLISREARR